MIVKLILVLLGIYVMLFFLRDFLPIGIWLGFVFSPIALFIGTFIAHWVSVPEFRKEIMGEEK